MHGFYHRSWYYKRQRGGCENAFFVFDSRRKIEYKKTLSRDVDLADIAELQQHP